MKVAIMSLLALAMSSCSKTDAGKSTVAPGRFPTEKEFQAYLESNIHPSGELTVMPPRTKTQDESDRDTMWFAVKWQTPLFPNNQVSLTVVRYIKDSGDEMNVTARTFVSGQIDPIVFGRWEFKDGSLVKELVHAANTQQWEWLKPRADMLKTVMSGARP